MVEATRHECHCPVNLLIKGRVQRQQVAALVGLRDEGKAWEPELLSREKEHKHKGHKDS